jgi:reactive intermediate/imine deaminase
MSRSHVETDRAPAAIGSYSQAVRAGDTVYLSGQIPLDPATMELVAGGPEAQIRQVFDNLAAVAEAAGGSLADAVKLNVYLTDLDWFAEVNRVMETIFDPPYPARAAVGVASLPRGAGVEVEAVLVLER